MRIGTSRARNFLWTAAPLAMCLLFACSASHHGDRTDEDGSKAPREDRDGVRPGGAGSGADPNDDDDDANGPDPRGSDDPNENPAGPPTDPSRDPPPGLRPELTCVTPGVGPSPLRRLTHFEYDNSVRDLLGDTSAPGSGFVPDAQAGLFDTAVEGQTVSARLGEQYLDAAIALAEAADVTKVVGCSPVTETCMHDFIRAFGRRAYRRPLEAAEVDDMLATFRAAGTAVNPTTGARAVIAAVLASANFLFRPEYGGAASALPNATRVTPFELAARLASLLWASLPDDALLDAAANGQLETDEQVEAQSRRMLLDEHACGALAAFYEQWFGLERLSTVSKDPAVYPTFDDALRGSMAGETRAFVDHVLWQDDARLTTLLTASYSFVNAPLADLYGVARPLGDELTQTALDPLQRAGVLTQASVLTAFASMRQSSPVLRGVWVRTRLLCQDLPASPPMVPELPPEQNGVSNRERVATLTADAACRGCHALIDDLGFGLEHYDGIGAYRERDQGLPIDASGEIRQTRDIDGPFDGGPALAQRLGSSEQVHDCAATQWLRYALGRREEADDSCSLVALREAFAATRGDLQALMLALTQTDAFRSYRQAP